MTDSRRIGVTRRWGAVLVLALGATLLAPSPASANVLDCDTYTDGHYGSATCHNPSNTTRTFRAVVICGWWPDAYGPWVSVAPHQKGVSSATCGGGSGAGAVGVDQR
ncbi:hypothetical protein [Streptomonospora litoralis]|uniref:Secreted protein n=1 Tax=Streptomonospora litoralis TaxID=2498135 RepID=A0A4P6Q0Q0_9ACTN|nr:hypothetical protein [Streptomonospora litoralis]QBI52117.1 hypothetical protein EKD16_01500 [Streptomonospora litoralis]